MQLYHLRTNSDLFLFQCRVVGKLFRVGVLAHVGSSMISGTPQLQCSSSDCSHDPSCLELDTKTRCVSSI